MTSPRAGSIAAPSGSNTRLRRRREAAVVGLFTSPAFIWYVVFTIGPMIAIFVISLLYWGGFLSTPEWAGLENFRRMFTDPVFHTAVGNTVLQVGVGVTLMIPLAFMLGYYVNLKPRFHRLLRVILFTPALISLAATGTAFYAIFQPQGALNGLLRAIGLDSVARPWLADTKVVMWVIIAVGLWSGIGYTAILFAARLASVDSEVYEAAALDGCGHWATMWRITFPIVKDYFGVLTMLQFLWTTFASAGLILLLTRGGPGTSSTTLSYLVYSKAFIQSQVGYSQAVGVVLFFVGVLGMFVIRRVFRANY